MHLQILQIAASKDKNIKALEADYEKRLKPYLKLESLSLSASKADDRSRAQAEERDQFLSKLKDDHTLIALDETGKQMSSPDFAKLLKDQRDYGPGKLQFLIGGSNGLHPDILKSAHYTLSLSKMTFTHEMVRVFLKEQLYRACMINAGKRYHK